MTANHGGHDAPGELRRELVACHREAYLWSRNCCRGNPEEAEDVLQATYLKILDGKARFDGQSSFVTWLFGVIRLTAADHRRRRALRDFLALRWGLEESRRDPAPDAGAGVEATEERLRFERALERLPLRQREVLLMVFYHDLSVVEAARVMRIGAGSARRHYARGKERLRQLLATGQRS